MSLLSTQYGAVAATAEALFGLGARVTVKFSRKISQVPGAQIYGTAGKNFAGHGCVTRPPATVHKIPPALCGMMMIIIIITTVMRFPSKQTKAAERSSSSLTIRAYLSCPLVKQDPPYVRNTGARNMHETCCAAPSNATLILMLATLCG